MQTASKLTVDGLHLFKSLIKDGCTWHGDVCSNKWSECLYFEDKNKEAVEQTLYAYESGVHFKLEDGCVWIY